MKVSQLWLGSFFLLLASIISRGSSLIFRYIAAISLSTNDYGILSLYVSLFLSLATIASFGVAPALAKLGAEKSNTKADIDIYYNTSIQLTVATSFLAGCIYVLIISRGSVLLSTPIISVTIGGLILWSYYQISIGLSISNMNFVLASIYEAGDGLIKLLLLILIAYFSASTNNIYLYVIVFTMSYVVLSCIAIISNKHILKINTYRNPFYVFSGKSIRKIFNQSFGLMIITFSNLFFGFLLRWLLSRYSNFYVAIFDMAFTLYSVPRMVFASIVRPVVPYASKTEIMKIKIPPLKSIILFYLLGLIIAIAILRFGYADTVFRIIKLKEYSISYPIFLVLASCSIFDLCFGYLSSYFQGIGKIIVISIISAGVFVLMIPISYFMIHQYTIYGAAGAFCAFTILTTILTIGYSIKNIGFQKYN